MRHSTALVLLATAAFSLACGSKESSTPANEKPEQATPPTEAAAPAPATEIHVRGLFYYERSSASGVTTFPEATEHSPRSAGEKAWLEVHTQGASHAYAFTVFPDGAIESVWTEDIAKKKHTPPMNAFNEGLDLTAEYIAGTTLLVVASEEALEGVDTLGDCTESPSTLCGELQRMLREDIPLDAPTHALRMRHMDIETPAFGSVNTGSGRSAIAFKIKEG